MNFQPLKRYITSLTLLFCCGMALGQTSPSADIKTAPIVDWPMRLDPILLSPEPPRIVTSQMQQIWRKALNQSEIQVQIQTLQAISNASQLGIKGLKEKYASKIKTLLKREQTHIAVAMAAVKTLIIFDDQSAADLIFKRNQSLKLDWILLTDSTLAKWQYMPAIEQWIKRTTDPTLSWTIRNSAMKQLATTHPDKAQGPLRQLLGQTSLNPLLKLSAAKALGQIATHGLLDDAQRLAKGDLTSKLTAIACLQSHDSQQVRTFLSSALSALNDGESTYALEAGQLLFKIAPAELARRCNRFIDHQAPAMRMLAAQCLIHQITPQRVAQVAKRLGDDHPVLRTFVRDALIKLASKSDLAPSIKQAAKDQIKQDKWQAQEQAAYILGKLDVEDASDLLFNVLQNANRPEARIAAATAIRWLDVKANQAQALTLAHQLFQDMKKQLASDHALELAQLLQWFGESRYQQAYPLLLEFVPKNIAPGEPREAAIWALGKIGPTPKAKGLDNKLVRRVKDMNEMNPESPNVQMAAMVTLTRLGKNKSIQNFLNTSDSPMMMIDTGSILLYQTWSKAIAEGKKYVIPMPEPTPLNPGTIRPLKTSMGH